MRQPFCWNFMNAVKIPCSCTVRVTTHDDVIKWKDFPRHWPFVRGIHRSPVNSTRKGQWRGALMFPGNQALSKQWRCRWFETPSRSLWRHCNATVIMPIDVVFSCHFFWSMMLCISLCNTWKLAAKIHFEQPMGTLVTLLWHYDNKISRNLVTYGIHSFMMTYLWRHDDETFSGPLWG